MSDSVPVRKGMKGLLQPDSPGGSVYVKCLRRPVLRVEKKDGRSRAGVYQALLGQKRHTVLHTTPKGVFRRSSFGVKHQGEGEKKVRKSKPLSSAAHNEKKSKRKRTQEEKGGYTKKNSLGGTIQTKV